MMMRPLCPRCKVRKRQAHRNSKWCKPCALALRRQPKGTLTAAQRRFAIQHSGDMTVPEIAKRLKTSTSNVKRSCRDVRFHAVNGKYKYRPALVNQILEHYFENGLPETIKAFPTVNVKSITDRPEYYGIKRQYRQIRWTPEQHLEAVKMAGLIPLNDQALYFNRPRANAGAMKSFWVKRMPVAGGQLHGLVHNVAKHIVTNKCPRLKIWTKGRRLVLWVDAEKHLKPGTPEFIEIGVRTMADFTRWIFGRKHPKRVIMRMIEERRAPQREVRV